MSIDYSYENLPKIIGYHCITPLAYIAFELYENKEH
jgi:hypothetical protein